MGAQNSSQAWDAEADVVVVGFGAAGACAALEARQHGASALAVDRFHGGGATAASGAIVYAGGGTPYQQAAGYDDSPEDMYRYLKLEVGDVVSDETLRRFCNESDDNLLWLQQLGVPFEASLCPFKTSYPTDDYYLYFSGNELVGRYKAIARPAPRGHRAKGKGISGLTLFRALEKAARERGVHFHLQTEVQGLIFSDDGRVIGVEGRSIPSGRFWADVHRRLSKVNAKATTYLPPAAKRITAAIAWITERHSKPFRVRARKGIVLAAGGFIFNTELVRQYAPIYLRCRPLGTIGDDGAGIRLGQSAGGATAHMDRMTAWRFYVPPEALMQGILVNRQGERICGEDLYGATVSEHIVANDGYAFLVFDSKTYRQSVHTLRSQSAPFQLLSMLPMFLLGRKKAASLAELAAKIGVSAPGLETTVSEYNSVARMGGPDPLGKTPERFVPQDSPPFYAVDCSLDASHGVPCTAMTLGGLVVEEETGLVLREDGSTIEGLYAAGRNAVGVCSQSYVSGLSIADCVYSGRRAGRHAATASREL